MDQEQTAFRDRFRSAFDAHFPRIFRYLDRATGDPQLASDLAQEAFMRLLARGSMPESPDAWLVSVAANLLRNEWNGRARRRRLLTPERARRSHGDPPPGPERRVESEAVRARVRAALDALPERERDLLLLRAEGYSYRDLAGALALNEASVGTLLARARRRFREAWEGTDHAS